MSVRFEAKGTGVGDTVEATSRYGHTYNETSISDVTFNNSVLASPIINHLEDGPIQRTGQLN